MNKASKILVTIVVIVVFMILSLLIQTVREGAGHQTSGIMGMIVMAAMIGALSAVWKKKGKRR